MERSDPKNESTGHFAHINGLRMYYELSGEGAPILLLPGALSGIQTAFGKLIPLLREKRKVLAIEFQGYAHTEDIPGRPLTYEQFTDDIIRLLDLLELSQVDILGYSTGAGVALQIAIQRPDLVQNLILASVSYQSSGRHPDLKTLFKPEFMEQALKDSPYEQEYLSFAPKPKNWPQLLKKVSEFEHREQNWDKDAIKNIKAPALIIAGDADIIQAEHTVSLFRLLGGGSLGELAMPSSQLAILPGTMHTGLTQQTDLLVPMIFNFLDKGNKTRNA